MTVSVSGSFSHTGVEGGSDFFLRGAFFGFGMGLGWFNGILFDPDWGDFAMFDRSDDLAVWDCTDKLRSKNGIVEPDEHKINTNHFKIDGKSSITIPVVCKLRKFPIVVGSGVNWLLMGIAWANGKEFDLNEVAVEENSYRMIPGVWKLSEFPEGIKGIVDSGISWLLIGIEVADGKEFYLKKIDVEYISYRAIPGVWKFSEFPSRIGSVAGFVEFWFGTLFMNELLQGKY
jgi:hypothetical protein